MQYANACCATPSSNACSVFASARGPLRRGCEVPHLGLALLRATEKRLNLGKTVGNEATQPSVVRPRAVRRSRFPAADDGGGADRCAQGGE